MNNLTKDITTNDFKNYFKREFKYIIDWVDNDNYNKDVVVRYNNIFYLSLINNNINNNPETNKIAWEEIEIDVKDYLDNFDIEKAIIQARGNFNEKLFSNDIDLLKSAFLLLVAHYVVMDRYMSVGGGATNFMISSKSVGSVSVSYSIPQTLMNKPLFAYLSRTEFGMKYISYLLSRTTGTVRTIRGTTIIK